MNNLSTPFDQKELIIEEQNHIINSAIINIMNTSSLGQKFNEITDINIKHKDILSGLYDFADKKLDMYLAIMITTGKFGRLFRNWIQCNGFNYDTVYEIESDESLEVFKEHLKDLEFIIVGDMIPENHEFIKNHVKSLGGIYKGTFVIYDHTKNDPEVYSLY